MRQGNRIYSYSSFEDFIVSQIGKGKRAISSSTHCIPGSLKPQISLVKNQGLQFKDKNAVIQRIE